MLVDCVDSYLPRETTQKKEETEERHTKFQVPMGQPGGDVHGAIASIGLECKYSQGYRFRRAKNV